MLKLLSLTTRNLASKKGDVSFFFFFVAVLGAVFALQLSGVSIGRWGVDEGMYILGIETQGAMGVNSMADRVVVSLTPFFKIGPLYNAVPTIGIVYIITRIAYQANVIERLIIFYLSFPLIFQLQFVSKEAIISFFVILLFGIFSFVRSEKARLIITLGGLALLAASFRQYYAISVAIFLCLFFVRDTSLRLLFVAAGIVAAGMVEAIRLPLLEARYFIYYGVSDAAMSKTPLLFTGYGPVDFIGNYIVTLIFSTFPIFLNLRIQELYMQIYMLLIFFSLGEAFRRGDRVLVTLFCGIGLTLPVFVAELGTLSRHLGAVLPLLLMSFYFAPQAVETRRRKREPDESSSVPMARRGVRREAEGQ